MKSSAKKIELASVDDLFSTEEGRQDAKLEKIQEIPLSELHPFKNHPFKVKDDEAMMETADSIKQYGVLVPAIARPDPEGGYELVYVYYNSVRGGKQGWLRLPPPLDKASRSRGSRGAQRSPARVKALPPPTAF